MYVQCMYIYYPRSQNNSYTIAVKIKSKSTGNLKCFDKENKTGFNFEMESFEKGSQNKGITNNEHY